MDGGQIEAGPCDGVAGELAFDDVKLSCDALALIDEENPPGRATRDCGQLYELSGRERRPTAAWLSLEFSS